MTLAEAIQVVLEHLEEHRYEDRGCDYSECPECGWNTKEDPKKAAEAAGVSAWEWG